MEVATLPKWLDKRGIARELSCSVRYIERRMEEGMPHAHIAGRAKFRIEEVEAWLEKRAQAQQLGPAEWTALYRMFAEDGALLYVGISTRGPRRFSEHQADQPWWTSVASATLEHFEYPHQATAAERKAIRDEHPRFNVVHREAEGE